MWIPRPALKRPAAPVPAKKTTTQKPGPSAKKKKKSLMRGMLEEGLLAGYKSVDPTPGPQTSGRPRPGQEDHHPEAGAFCQEKEKEFDVRHVGRGSAGRL